MTSTETRAAFSLAGIFSLRMLGLFMIYPVFTFYAEHLAGSTPLTVGLALGAYGLTQALLQIPFGMLSDRIGRKRMITIGLLIFAAGSVVAAMSGTIHGVILGRILQGAGAVGSVILALGADLTRETERTKAMAIIGMTIGLSFALSLVLGPLLDAVIGVPGIFWLTALLAVAGIGVLFGVTPQPAQLKSHRDTGTVPALFSRVLGDAQLLRLDFGIFALHAILTASFIALPNVLHDIIGIPQSRQWMVWLPVLAASVVIMVPMIILAEAKRQMKAVFVGAIVTLGLTQVALLIWHASLVELVVVLTLFFAAFNIMEASLPSLISKVAPAEAKGTAMGVYSSSQFFGIFVGGTVGGWAYGVDGPSGVFIFSALAALIWFGVAVTMKQPRFTKSHMINVAELDDTAAEHFAARLRGEEGVVEAVVVPEDGVIYLKVDSAIVGEDDLERFSRRPAEA
ncbi:membrane protein [Salinisphaera orenii MK-B5]|uniref:Membrane protein n=1 Tax=Salinisphaera orenii MK-B5 TaxID=856730 RepID=A0A423PNT4_9GAMM|nr:MFS transporter [Salinisphaera orenii]ROO27259.1 membrane protein [Salinisphaera orenii MK-B5]